MSEYLSVLKQSMKESIKLAMELQNSAVDTHPSQTLKKYVQECNQKILEAFISTYPHASPVEIINFYLENYKYQRLKCEGRFLSKTNVIFENKILSFATVLKYYPSYFSFSDDLNTLLFRMIIVLNSRQEFSKELIYDSPKKFQLEKYGISRNGINFWLKNYLLEASNGDTGFSIKYARKSSINLIYRQIIRSMSDATYTRFCRNCNSYKNIPVKNILVLLMDAIVTEQEATLNSSRVIKRHPAWCYYNMMGNGKCSEFNIECHSTIGCPFFKKALRTPSGAIKIDTSDFGIT